MNEIKSVLFGVDSMFQLIISINLRTTIYKNCKAGIVLYNSVPTMKKMSKKLEQTGVFDDVYFADTSLAYCGRNYTFKQKLPKYFVYIRTLFSPVSSLRSIIGNKTMKKYDLFLFNSYGALPECIFNACLKRNHHLRCYRFEDGYVSYFTEFGSKKGTVRKTIERVSDLFLGRENISNYIDGIYFEEPELVLTRFPYPVISSPKISRTNKELVTTLNEVFDYEPDDIYPQKDVYLFEDGRLFFDKNEEEVDIIREIIKFVPKECVAVKPHPRRKEDRFSKFGVDVIKAGKTPWEVIQLNNDFTGKIFITVASSIAFSSDVYFGDKCYKVLLYRCLRNKPSSFDDRFERYIESYRRKYGNESLIIPETYTELSEKLKCII